jgi:Protein of unknown function (DUF2442)
MTSSINSPDSRPTATAADVTADRLHVILADGRELLAPVAWFDWLAAASEAQRADLGLIEGGEGIWWEQLDEGVSVPGLFGLAHT